MLKYVDTKEVFAEIPDEITLAISISGCPIRCRGCHSRYLWEDIGEVLTTDALSAMLAEHFGVTCLCFMGGDNDPVEVNRLASWTKEHSHVKVAWYSGRDEIVGDIELKNFDYVKVGRYDAERGPLNERETNQRFWRVMHNNGTDELVDDTRRFWKSL